MKFTIALTFFAAASALELKNAASDFMAALNTPVSKLMEPGFECALHLGHGMLENESDRLAFDDALFEA